MRSGSFGRIVQIGQTHEVDLALPARATYRGRRTIPSLLIEIMTDGDTRTVDEIYDALLAHPDAEGSEPARRGAINGLGDLVRDGRLQKVGRGVYKIGAGAANENGDGRGGPNPAVHPGDQKTLDEQQVDTARPGHPS